jgi:hypothetical protein
MSTPEAAPGAAGSQSLVATLAGELVPVGALQGLLAGRITRAAWRLERAERIEAELLDHHACDNADLGRAGPGAQFPHGRESNRTRRPQQSSRNCVRGGRRRTRDLQARRRWRRGCSPGRARPDESFIPADASAAREPVRMPRESK